MNNKKLWVFLLIAFFFSGVSGSYFLYHKFLHPEKSRGQSHNGPLELQDISPFRIFYPVDNNLQVIEKNLPRRMRQAAVAESVIEEYLKGPGNGKPSIIPTGVRLLGVYKDPRQILYIDLSDEVRRNFRGDAISEYLLLKGLYESVVSNVQDIEDLKILVEGKEIESLGGHFFLKYPLKNVVASEFRGDKFFSGE